VVIYLNQSANDMHTVQHEEREHHIHFMALFQVNPDEPVLSMSRKSLGHYCLSFDN